MTIFEIISVISGIVTILGVSVGIWYNIRRAKTEAATVDMEARVADSTVKKTDAETNSFLAKERLEELNRLYPEFRQMQKDVSDLRDEIRQLREDKDTMEEEYKQERAELVDLAMDTNGKLGDLRKLFTQMVKRSNITMTQEEQETFDKTQPRPLPTQLMRKLRAQR